MERVSDLNRCPICDHPDGCLYALDGSAAICSRVKEGSIKTVGEGPFSGGYLHIIKSDFKPKSVRKKRPVNINWNTLCNCYVDAYLKPLNKGLFSTLPPFPIHITTLYAIEMGWDGGAYTFPVRNSDDQIIGIQRRFPDGTKAMVSGSKLGIFIPRLNWSNLMNDDCPLFICEGVSDLATALDMGLYAIGRANCQTGKGYIIKFCIKKRPQRVVIIADNDEAKIRPDGSVYYPGQEGAKALGLHLSQGHKLFTVTRPDIKVVVPPTGIKDLRQWREKGLLLDWLMDRVEENLDIEP